MAEARRSGFDRRRAGFNRYRASGIILIGREDRMSAEKETLQRVQGGLYHLQRGLTPFVEGRMKSAHAANWLNYASRASGGAAPLALGVMLAFVPLPVRSVIVPAVKVFAVRSWNSQCKRKSTSKQKGKTPKECVSNANTHSDLLSKRNSRYSCIMATSPDFHSRQVGVVDNKAAPTVHIWS